MVHQKLHNFITFRRTYLIVTVLPVDMWPYTNRQGNAHPSVYINNENSLLELASYITDYLTDY